jgi:hypothetical protein
MYPLEFTYPEPLDIESVLPTFYGMLQGSSACERIGVKEACHVLQNLQNLQTRRIEKLPSLSPTFEESLEIIINHPKASSEIPNPKSHHQPP